MCNRYFYGQFNVNGNDNDGPIEMYRFTSIVDRNKWVDEMPEFRTRLIPSNAKGDVSAHPEYRIFSMAKSIQRWEPVASCEVFVGLKGDVSLVSQETKAEKVSTAHQIRVRGTGTAIKTEATSITGIHKVLWVTNGGTTVVIDDSHAAMVPYELSADELVRFVATIIADERYDNLTQMREWTEVYESVRVVGINNKAVWLAA